MRAANDAVVVLPDPLPDLEQDLGRRVVVELPDRALLGARENGVSDLDRAAARRTAPCRSRSRRARLNRPDSVLKWTRHAVRVLVDGEDLGAEADLVLRAPRRTRSGRASMPPTIACMSTYAPPRSSRSTSTTELCMSALDEVHDRVVLDRALATSPWRRRNSYSEYWSYRATISSQPAWPSCSTIAAQVADRRLPQLVRGAPALAMARARTAGVSGSRVRPPPSVMRWPADVHEALGVAHHERPHRQVEQLAVARASGRARAGCASPPASAYSPGANVAQRVDAAADAVLRLEHERPRGPAA